MLLVTADHLMNKGGDLRVADGTGSRPPVGALKCGVGAGEKYRLGDRLILAQRGQGHGLAVVVTELEIDEGFAAHHR